MAVIRCEEQHKGRGGTITGNTVKTARVFQIETNDATDGIIAIRAAGVLPSYGDVHPADVSGSITAREISIEPADETRLIWTATVQYTNESTSDSTENEAQELNPMDRPPIIEWQGVPREKGVLVDRTGKLVANSAGDRFDPPLVMQIFDQVALVTVNLEFVPEWIFTLQGHVNADEFTIDGLTVEFASALMGPVRVSRILTENGYRYREVQYELHFRGKREAAAGEDAGSIPDPWDEEVVDMGLREKHPSIGKDPRNVKDGDGSDVTAPVHLDGEGRKIANFEAGNEKYLVFKVRPLGEFGDLPGLG